MDGDAQCLQTATLSVCICVFICFSGQYWSSLKPSMGTVGMSFLGAQRKECEETDTVNAMASLSVGVLTSKRWVQLKEV